MHAASSENEALRIRQESHRSPSCHPEFKKLCPGAGLFVGHRAEWSSLARSSLLPTKPLVACRERQHGFDSGNGAYNHAE